MRFLFQFQKPINASSLVSLNQILCTLEWEPIEEKYLKRLIRMHKRMKGYTTYVKRLKDASHLNDNIKTQTRTNNNSLKKVKRIDDLDRETDLFSQLIRP